MPWLDGNLNCWILFLTFWFVRRSLLEMDSVFVGGIECTDNLLVRWKTIAGVAGSVNLDKMCLVDNLNKEKHDLSKMRVSISSKLKNGQK